MKTLNMEKYSFYTDGMTKYSFYTDGKSKVVAVSTYAGKAVRGVAKCDINDTFSFEKGKELAAARCNEKIAKKRLTRAENKRRETTKEYMKIMIAIRKVNCYKEDSEKALINAENIVASILETM